MHLSELAKILDAPLQGHDALISSISTNTRELLPGQLFVALKGDQYDAHDFLQSACDKKAGGAIISSEGSWPIPTIKVADTRLALGKIASYHRNHYSLPVIGVTGSCGKTTTKTMLASILNQMGPTLAPVRSFNNEVGVPLTLLQLIKEHQYAVIEMGANHPGEISYLSGMAQQNVAVITNIAPAHLAGFGDINGVAKAKGEIYEALPDEGVAIINEDDDFAATFRRQLNGKRIISFGIKNSADIVATNIHLDDEGRAYFDVTFPAGKFKIHLPILGIHNVMNALAAIAASFAVEATTQAMVTGLNQFDPVNKRLIKYQGYQGYCVIDDTYNANPLSVTAALKMLTHGAGEKIFVFGDMAELGKDEERFHIEVGQQARELGINRLYACGKLSQLTATAFGENGFYFKDQASLIEALKDVLHAKATVLIKGSRSSQMENVVQALIQEI